MLTEGAHHRLTVPVAQLMCMLFLILKWSNTYISFTSPALGIGQPKLAGTSLVLCLPACLPSC